jgi:predicted HTH transcriptional regulator
MSSYILNLIEQGENQQLDFKFEISDSKRIARTMAAFANTDGGKLLIGVKDNGKIAGVRSDEEYYMLEGAAQMYTKPEIKFLIKTWNIGGKTVMEVDIPKSISGLYAAPDEDGKWKFFVRVKDKTLLANSIMIKVWERRKAEKAVFLKYSPYEKILLDYLDSNEIISLSKFCKIAHITKQMAENTLVNLIVLEIIEQQLTENNCLFRLVKKQVIPK